MNHSKYFADMFDAVGLLAELVQHGTHRAEVVKYLGGWYVHWQEQI